MQQFLTANYTGPLLKDNNTVPDFPIDLNGETLLHELYELPCLIAPLQSDCPMEKSKALFLLQQCLEEPSCTVYEELMAQLSQIEEESVSVYLLKYYVALFHAKSLKINRRDTTELLEKAIALSGLEIAFTGAYGKRTKFQQDDKLQLVLKITKHGNSSDKSTVETPKQVPLSHDTLLDEIDYADPVDQVTLSPLEQCILLAKATWMLEQEAQNDMTNEQVHVIVQYVLKSPTNWSITSYALLLRSRIEMLKTKTMERALLQYEELQTQMSDENTSREEKNEYIFAIGLPSFPRFQLEIAEHYLRFGALKSALDIYKRFKKHDMVVLCMQSMSLKSEAEAYILEALKTTTSETQKAKLYCYLGDCREDHTLYATAWHMAHIPLAQFRLAAYYFQNNEYSNAYEAYRTALGINAMKPQSWFMAGCCALKLEAYENAVQCFKRATHFDDNMEAWNNMSSALLQLGRHHEAQRALQQAIKDSTSWKVWMNYMYVSTLCGELQEAIEAAMRLLQLTRVDWTRDLEQPDVASFEQVIQAAMAYLTEHDNSFMVEQLITLGKRMEAASPCIATWTCLARILDACGDRDLAFDYIHKCYMTLKSNKMVFNKKSTMKTLCNTVKWMKRIDEKKAQPCLDYVKQHARVQVEEMDW